MRRTSWIDQRINDGVSVLLWLQLGVAFFWRRRIGAMADHRHHDEGEHHQRDVANSPGLHRTHEDLRDFVSDEDGRGEAGCR
jgi:hypothetical protein